MSDKNYKGRSVRDIVIEIAIKQEVQEQTLIELKTEDGIIHKRISGIKIITTISSFVGGIAGGFFGFFTVTLKGKL